jgi:hypothetical protein
LTLSSLIDFSLALTPSAAWLAEAVSTAAGVRVISSLVGACYDVAKLYAEHARARKSGHGAKEKARADCVPARALM